MPSSQDLALELTPPTITQALRPSVLDKEEVYALINLHLNRQKGL